MFTFCIVKNFKLFGYREWWVINLLRQLWEMVWVNKQETYLPSFLKIAVVSLSLFVPVGLRSGAEVWLLGFVGCSVNKHDCS